MITCQNLFSGYFAHRAPSAILYNKDIAVDFGFSACEKYIAMTEKERAEAKFSYPVSNGVNKYFYPVSNRVNFLTL